MQHNLVVSSMEMIKIGPSGGSLSTWELYDTINFFMGSFKSNRITQLMDESFVLDEESYSPMSSTMTSSQNEEAAWEISLSSPSPVAGPSSSPLDLESTTSSSIAGTSITSKIRRKNINSEDFLLLSKQEKTALTVF